MKTQKLSNSNLELWTILGKVRHSIFLVRQKELNQYNLSASHAYLLRIIIDLGSKATIFEVAKKVDRKISVISRQTARMEKDGLIKRIKQSPKKNILQLELTKKGLDMAKISYESKSLDILFSCLSSEDRQQMESSLNRLLIKLAEITSDLSLKNDL